LLGVAQGSTEPPRFLVFRYRGKRGKGTDIALVGKGITFDSGGISLKPADKMEQMKGDMAGGAAVMNTMNAIAKLKPEINVMGVVALTENLPSGGAMKPGDVFKAMNGKTIEVISTDAEGRMTLADALCYVERDKPKYILDIATLTGSCQATFSDIYAAGFTNNQSFLNKVIAAGAEAGELIWQLPMNELYREYNKSDIADVRNVGLIRFAGAIVAATFLAEFVEDTPWVHLDIASTDLSEKDRGQWVKGGTGYGTRTLINLVLGLAKR
jgi:leucyl aminopeptidase